MPVVYEVWGLSPECHPLPPPVVSACRRLGGTPSAAPPPRAHAHVHKRCGRVRRRKAQQRVEEVRGPEEAGPPQRSVHVGEDLLHEVVDVARAYAEQLGMHVAIRYDGEGWAGEWGGGGGGGVLRPAAASGTPSDPVLTQEHEREIGRLKPKPVEARLSLRVSFAPHVHYCREEGGGEKGHAQQPSKANGHYHADCDHPHKVCCVARPGAATRGERVTL